jgi:hypothetical protein
VTAPPRGKLADVPLMVRRMCSLLYRATRRQAVAIDRVTDDVSRLRDRVGQLEDQLEAVERDVTRLFDRVDQPGRWP